MNINHLNRNDFIILIHLNSSDSKSNVWNSKGQL